MQQMQSNDFRLVQFDEGELCRRINLGVKGIKPKGIRPKGISSKEIGGDWGGGCYCGYGYGAVVYAD